MFSAYYLRAFGAVLVVVAVLVAALFAAVAWSAFF